MLGLCAADTAIMSLSWGERCHAVPKLTLCQENGSDAEGAPYQAKEPAIYRLKPSRRHVIAI